MTGGAKWATVVSAGVRPYPMLRHCTKEQLGNDIQDTYKCFRLDKTARTQPPDPHNKKNSGKRQVN